MSRFLDKPFDYTHIIFLKEKLDRKDKQIKDLEAENRLLKTELTELRTKLFGHKAKDKGKKDAKKEPRKRGAPKGHAGWFRKVPKKIDKTVELHPYQCPSCGGKDITGYDRT